MNAPASSSTQLLDRSVPAFTFDPDNPAIMALWRHVSAGYCCQVLGPRGHLKSRLIQVAGTLLTELGTHYVVYLDLAQVESDDRFFANLEARTRAALPPLPGQLVEECQSATDLQFALAQMAAANDRNLLLIIDHLEFAPPNLVALLLSAVRAAHTASMDDFYGSPLQAVVCGSLLLSQVALQDADRFESISQTVMVPDLSRAESRRLLVGYLTDMHLTIVNEAVDVLLDWVDGDALLITETAHILSQLATSSGRMVIDRHDASLAIQEMHRAVGAQIPLIDETVRHIANDVRLLTVVCHLLEHAQPPADSVDSQEMRTLLELSGVIARSNNTYRIKSTAWEYLLRDRLGTGYVGRLFARAGNWSQAINYLGQAQVDPAEEKQDYRPELFAAIINAIHDSRDERHAFASLADGLQAAYPERDLLVYMLDPEERAFKLVTSLAAKHPYVEARISLGDSTRPEVLACSGTEYSISLVEGETRLLFPLQLKGARGDPLGLVSADEGSRPNEGYQPWDEGVRPDAGHQLWEEREVLLGFLRNALRALNSKQRFHELLNSASQRAELWRVLDKIKTLLHDPDLSEDTVWRVMLEGVTHGRGLGFNRAILFTPDTEGRLVIRHAVGYADRAPAEEYWRRHPYTEEPTEVWLANLVERHRRSPPQPGELERSLRGLVVELDESDSLLAQCFRGKEPVHVHSHAGSGAGSVAMPTAIRHAVQPADEFVFVPLPGARAPLGALYADNKFSGQRIPGEQYRMLHNFVAQIALVVEGARALAYERELRHLEQVQREQIDRDLQDLQELQRALQFNLGQTGDERLDDVVRAELSKVCQTALGARAWLIRVAPRDRWQIMAYGGAGSYSGWQADEAPPELGRSEAKAMLPHTVPFADSVSVGLSAYLQTGSEKLFVAPVEVNGNHQATLYVESSPGSTLANQEKVVERAAYRLGVVMGQVQNVQVLQRLVAMSLRLTREEPLYDTLNTIVREAMEFLGGVSTVTLYAIDERDDIVLAACEGVRYPDQMKSRPPYNSSVVESIVKDGKEFFVTDVDQKRPFRRSTFVEREGIRSVAALPLNASGRQLGGIFFSYRRPHLFSDAERSALSLFAQLATAELLTDRLDRELKKMTELEQYIVQGTLGNEFIHRLNGTIAGMLDHVDEIGDLVGANTGIRELLDLLRMKVDGLERLSADIRQRLNEVMREAKREPRELGPLMEQVVEQLKREAPRNVAMTFHTELPAFSYPIDSLFFEMLLEHLIRNAWDAIPDDRAGHVEVSLEQGDNGIRIAVRDNGLGIPAANRRSVFDPSFSTRQPREERGKGLTISQWIAKLHGGQLKLGSSDSQGTTFYFELPETPE